MEDKKKIEVNPEVKDEELDEVAGGIRVVFTEVPLVPRESEGN